MDLALCTHEEADTRIRLHLGGCCAARANQSISTHSWHGCSSVSTSLNCCLWYREELSAPHCSWNSQIPGSRLVLPCRCPMHAFHWSNTSVPFCFGCRGKTTDGMGHLKYRCHPKHHYAPWLLYRPSHRGKGGATRAICGSTFYQHTSSQECVNKVKKQLFTQRGREVLKVCVLHMPHSSSSSWRLPTWLVTAGPRSLMIMAPKLPSPCGGTIPPVATQPCRELVLWLQEDTTVLEGCSATLWWTLHWLTSRNGLQEIWDMKCVTLSCITWNLASSFSRLIKRGSQMKSKWYLAKISYTFVFHWLYAHLTPNIFDVIFNTSLSTKSLAWGGGRGFSSKVIPWRLRTHFKILMTIRYPLCARR